MPTRICVLTTGRQDWGILRTICKLGRASARLELILAAGGMALSKAHGASVEAMTAEGLAPDRTLAWLEAGQPIHAETAKALAAVGAMLAESRPDAILLAGDRSETAAAALAATLLRIPIAHLHGGEESEGAFDNALRHAITQLAHLHLVSHETYAHRVRAMGQDPSTVHVVGAPGLDSLRGSGVPTRAELEGRLGIPLSSPVVAVTLHPATLGADPALEADAVCEAMDRVPATYVVTLPNSDPGSAVIRERLLRAGSRPGRVAVEALGPFYGALLAHADAMLGNSSSGLVEAPAFGLPVVNVGARQKGRLRGPNVLDVESNAGAIAAGLERALAPGFRASIAEGSRAMYGGGGASKRVVEVLEEWTPPRPPVKRSFV
jgi:UDP-hydrolysing UDP-N-acetyl-D-glucosamine 2-epimerase